MLATRTQFSGYSVSWSPFRGGLLSVATSQYYGIAGNGRVLILDADMGLSPISEFSTKDGCFDVAWSEKNECILAAATGDGSIKIFDTAHPGSRPLVSLSGHAAETYSVDWNGINKDMLCTASWDRTVRIWDVGIGAPVGAPLAHSGIVYEARWAGTLLGSVSGDGQFRVWDTKSSRCVLSVPHSGEILCMDWNKYNSNVVVTGGVDRSVKVWDLRKPAIPVHVNEEHLLAVRRVKFDPHREHELASCSYDMTVHAGGKILDHHSEFVVGLGWSPLRPGYIASASWDRSVVAWTQHGQQRVPLARN